MHGLLVGLGALLLSVAAVGFLVFSWRVLSLSGRAAVIAVATLGVLATASWLRGRLPETAEAVGGLGVVLVLADCWAIRRTGLFGADQPEGLGYAAAATAVCALLLGVWALISRVRAGSLAAVVLAPLAIVLLAARLDDELGSIPVFATGFLLVAGLALGRGLLPVGWSAERWLLRAIAAGALIGAGGPAGFGSPGPGRAALVLAIAALIAATEVIVDRSGTLLDQGKSLLLRRIWSLAAGLLSGAAALQAARALAVAFELDGVAELIPLTALPVLAVVVAAGIPGRPGAAFRRIGFRRTAFGAGTVVVTAVAIVPLVALAVWLPSRAALVGVQAWTADPGDRLGDLAPHGGATSADWMVVLIGLVILGGGVLVAVRISGWPDWLRRPVGFAGVAAGGGLLIVLPLVPAAPVVVVVAMLTVLSVGSAVWVTSPAGLGHARTAFGRSVGGPDGGAAGGRSEAGNVDGEMRGRSRSEVIAGWTTSAVTGTLAVLLAWSCRDLSVPLTALGIVGLLLARRQLPTPSGPGPGTLAGLASAGLAGLAGAATPFMIGAGAGIAGASESQRAVWAGLISGVSAAALIGLPDGLFTARVGSVKPAGSTGSAGSAGRATWTGADRTATAIPGLIALVIGLLATLPDGVAVPLDGADWPRPTLLAVALLIALTGAGAVRPAVARALPVLPLLGAVAVAPLLGALAAAIRAEMQWTQLASSLIWTLAAAVAALVIAVVVLSGRADPGRRVATEIGVVLTGLIGLSLVEGENALWPVLLVLGAAAAAIATTPNRQRVGWLAGLLLTGSTWTRLAVGNVSLVEAYSLPPAFALLGLALYRFRRDPETDPRKALLPVATVGLGPSVLVAVNGPDFRPAVLIAVAAVLVLAGWRAKRQDRLALGAVLARIGFLTAAAIAVLRAGSALADQANPALSDVEVWTLPAALVLLIAGWTWFDRIERATAQRSSGQLTGMTPSWLAYAPGLAILLLPSLLAGSGPDGTPVREIGVITLAAAALIVGSKYRLQAPVLVGAGVLAVQAVVLLRPWIAELQATVPLWGWLALVGLGLILLGARYEAQMSQLRRLKLRLMALR